MTKRSGKPPTAFLGAFTLGLIFVAGAALSWTYLGSLAPDAQAQTAAAAQAEAASEVSHFPQVSIAAQSAIVIDETTGQTLYSLNPDVQWPLASLTKIALVLAVIGALPSDTLISTPAMYTSAPAGDTPRLPPGKTWTLDNAIDFTLVASSDDGADLLASAANSAIHQEYPQSPADGATLWRMNMLAQELGLTRTYFLNDSGLDISTTQSGAYGSARDVATLFAYAASTSPSIFAATTQQTITVSATDGSQATAANTNEALPSIPGIVMGKTGYTDLAGGNLAVIFDTGGHEIVAVVLGSTEDGRFSDMQTLVAAAQQAVGAVQ